MDCKITALLIALFLMGSVQAASTFKYVLIEFYKPGGLTTELTPEQVQEVEKVQESKQYFTGVFSNLNCFGRSDCATIKSNILKNANAYFPTQCGSKMSTESFALLMYYQIQQESSFNRMLVSSKGAKGLSQFMPPAAARFQVYDPFSIEQATRGQARYMRFLLQTFHCDYRLALAGYNAGEGAVQNAGNRVPQNEQTPGYVRTISGNYEAALARA